MGKEPNAASSKEKPNDYVIPSILVGGELVYLRKKKLKLPIYQTSSLRVTKATSESIKTNAKKPWYKKVFHSLLR